MATNKIYAFAQQSLNVLSDKEYETDQQRLIGHQPGVARAGLQNKASKQSNIMAAVLAQFGVDGTGKDVNDSMPVQEIAEVISEAVKSTAAPDIAIPADINAGTTGKLVNAEGLKGSIATTAEITTGTSGRFVDAAGLLGALAAQKAASGYTKLPNGLISQWGQGAGNNITSSAHIVFPIAFPNALLLGLVGEHSAQQWYQVGIDWCTIWGVDYLRKCTS